MDTVSEAWRRQGEAIAADHVTWAFTARPLLRAARLCWDRREAAGRSVDDGRTDNEVFEDLRLGAPALMLTGMGLEAALKALLLITDLKLVTSGGGTFYTHDLRALAQAVPGMAWTEGELNTLGKLGQFVVWAGRYPIPRWDNPSGKAKYDCPATVEGGLRSSTAPTSRGASGRDSGSRWRPWLRKSWPPTTECPAARPCRTASLLPRTCSPGRPTPSPFLA